MSDAPFAFPFPPAGSLGMTLRDYFAASALGSILVLGGTHWAPENKLQQARRAYTYADAMLKARES